MPIEYASVRITAADVTLLVAASVMIEAIIGPTHGVQMRPRLAPTASPPLNPSFDCVFGECLESFENNCSIQT